MHRLSSGLGTGPGAWTDRYPEIDPRTGRTVPLRGWYRWMGAPIMRAEGARATFRIGSRSLCKGNSCGGFDTSPS